MDALTLMVLKQTQPRAKVRDNREGLQSNTMCVSHVPPSSAQHYGLVDQPGPQGHCRMCGRAMRRPKLNPV